MYEAYQYTRHGSYELVAQGTEDTIERYVKDLAHELECSYTRIDGRFVEFGVWYYDMGENGVIVVDELT